MADQFRIIPYTVRSAGTDVPPEEVQAAINSLAQQTTVGLNSVASDPSGPASGDLGGTYPAPTVVAVHAISGTLDGVVIGGTTPAAGTFTTVAASTPVAVTSGGTGANALNAHNVIIGEGSSAVAFAAPGVSGQILASNGAAVDPSFQTKAALAIASSGANTDITSLNAPALGAATATTAAAGNSSTLVATTAFLTQPGPIGSGTANTGAFTTLSSTGTFTPSQTNGIVGTTTNNNVNAGGVGEFLQNSTTGTSLTTTTNANVTSISLTAGDWDLWGLAIYNAGAGCIPVAFAEGGSTTSVTFGAAGTFTSAALTFTTAAPQRRAVQMQRFSLSATTTVFLVVQAQFSGGTMTADGYLFARRRR